MPKVEFLSDLSVDAPGRRGGEGSSGDANVYGYVQSDKQVVLGAHT